MKLLALAVLSLLALPLPAADKIYTRGIDTIVNTTCTPPTSRTDGTAITNAELVSTKLIFANNSSGTDIITTKNNLDIFCTNSTNVSTLPDGVIYAMATTTDTDGNESALSAPKSLEIVTPAAENIIPKELWTKVAVDSEELVNWYMSGEQVFDNNPDTLWHSQYQGAEPPHPHWIVIDLGKTYNITGFQELSRKEAGCNGCVKDYEFYVSTNTTDWGTPASQGTFILTPGIYHTVDITPKVGRYIKFVALSEHDGGLETSVAELNVMGTEVIVSKPNPPIIIMQ